jgi:copper chaperone
METLNFKTNINTHDAVEAITLPLNNIEQIDGWNINTEIPDKLLTVQTTDNRIADLVQQAISQAGYQAELLTE